MQVTTAGPWGAELESLGAEEEEDPNLDGHSAPLKISKPALRACLGPPLSGILKYALAPSRLLISQDVGKMGFRQISFNIYILYQKWGP